jgi:site-specific recombinase XerD
MGIGRMIERAGEAAGLPFPVHVHMLRHSTGYALAARGMDTRRLQHFLGHASITNVAGAVQGYLALIFQFAGGLL